MHTLLRFFAILAALCCLDLHAGSLRVTLSPSQARSAGAQWRVDGGAWRNSGSTVNNLSNTTHTVDFKTITGWITPAATPVTISSGTTTLTATYVQPAALKITLAPANGQWRIDGGTWRTSGSTVTGLAPGNHNVEYSSVAGYAILTSETVALIAGQTTALNRSYTALAQVSVTLTPATAQWRIDGGAWQASGATVANLAPGAHMIDYAALSGYTAPVSESVTLASGQTLSLTRSYAQLADLSVSLSPASAQWRVDGGAWQASGATVANLAPGSHTIDYGVVAGYTAPTSESVALTTGQSLSLTRSYVQLTQVTVTLTPASAQWRVDGGAWLASAATAANLAPGSHTIDYAPLSGYTAPASESVTLAAGQSIPLNRGYVQLAQVSVTLTPANAQWQLDGGAWQSSGATVTNLSPGSHTLNFSTVAGYITPAAESVSLTPGQSLSLSRTYTQLASFTVSLTPGTAQWRLDGGAWQNSSTTLTNLALGAHTVDFADYPGYLTPVSETVTLASGSNPTLVRSYTASLAGYAEVVALPDLGTKPYLIRGSDSVLYGIANIQGGHSVGTFFKINPDGTGFTLLRSFPGYVGDGHSPTMLLEGSDGFLYGTTQYGGSETNRGVIFRSSPDGTNYSILRVFANAAEGHSPNTLVEAGDGWLYGTTLNGGLNDRGVIFKINKTGAGYAVLKEFATATLEGRYAARLVEGSDGALYGTVSAGGTGNFGLVYRMNKDGSNFAVTKNFAGGADGASPRTPLLRASDSNLYGTTGSGGTSNRGTAFRLNFDGTGRVILKNFLGDSTEGGGPASELTEDGAGVLYGATATGGAGTRGTVFKLNRDGTGYLTLKNFAGTVADGGAIQFSPILVSGATLHGVSRLGGAANDGVVFRLGTDGGNFSVLKNVGAPSGTMIMTPVAEGSTGVLYGTTLLGGATREGTLFKVNKDGTGLTVLRHFTGMRSSYAQSVIAASDGLLYGVAVSAGGGQIYRLNPDGTGLVIVRAFVAEGSPQGIIEASDGALYGTTDGGGTASSGTVFKINKDGSGYSVLRNFAGGATDGKYPYCGVIEGADGRLYGTTVQGGASALGTVYRLSKDGTGYAVLKQFANSTTDGSAPWSGVTYGSDGQLYGTTSAGGSAGFGVIYKMAADGTGFQVLRSFLGVTASDGSAPNYAGVVEHSGALYGTASGGGTFSRGTLYRLNRDGSGYTTLINFGAGLTDASAPTGTLLRSPDGALYGTTAFGGKGSTVFRFGPN